MYIILGVIALIIIFVIATFNSLVRLVNQAKEAWADIEVQLKRRFDLIPNLVNTIKGSTAFESGTLEKVVEARAKATSINIDPSKLDAAGMAKLQASQAELSSALGRLMVVAEAYPDLKSSQNFLALQNELSDTENKIQAARRFYNGTVRDLNIRIQSFPANIFANMFHFSKMEFFDIPDNDAAQQPVEVKF